MRDPVWEDLARKFREDVESPVHTAMSDVDMVKEPELIVLPREPPRRYPYGLDLDPASTFSRRVFRSGKFGCVVFNYDGPPELPVFMDVASTYPRHLRKLQVGSNEHPFAAYVLSNPSYDDKYGFFARLNVTYWSLPCVTISEGVYKKFEMEPKLWEKWLRSESALIFTINCFQKFFNCLYNLDFRKPILPSQRGFLGILHNRKGTQTTLHGLERSIRTPTRLRDFLPQRKSRHESYICGRHSTIHHTKGTSGNLPTEDVIESWPVWAQELVRQGKCHPEWVHALLFGEISDFTKQRAGCVIEMDNCDFMHCVVRMLRRRLPLIFPYPLDDLQFGLERLRDVPERYQTLFQLSRLERGRCEEEYTRMARFEMKRIKLPHPALAQARRAIAIYHNHGRPLERAGGIIEGRQPGCECEWRAGRRRTATAAGGNSMELI